MLNLNRNFSQNKTEWEKAGVTLPRFDRDKMKLHTVSAPKWVHFGAGNIFRGFIAELQQELLNADKADTGITAVEAYDEEIIEKIYKPFDDLSLLVLMNPDGSLDKRIVAGIGESLVGDTGCKADWERLKQIFANPSLQMVSFTITEKGYSLKTSASADKPDVSYDSENGPAAPHNIISKVCALAYQRFMAGAYPIAFVSMDNCSHNGEKLQNAMLEIIGRWVKNGLTESAFLDYMNDPRKVSFPWSMIDKITPRPAETVRDSLTQSGISGMDMLCTAKKTFIAPFVNAEVPRYLVIEDVFPNGRPQLELTGVIFTDRESVKNAERMKVTTCLNPLHTALAVFGCLLGYHLIADEMRDPELKALVEKIGYEEGMPVVVDPGILDPRAFIDEVITKRLPNPYIPDTPQRIVTDTSQKIPIRFGETIKSYLRRSDLDVKKLRYIPLVLAGWCRYLMGIDDNGKTMALSPDPMLDELTARFGAVRFGNPASAEGVLRPILSDKKLFAVDLYKAGLGNLVEEDFKQMIAGKHAVREVLRRCLK